MPGNCQGVAAGWLRAGCAALQSLLSGHGGLQHHTGHTVVSVAGCLIVSAVQMWTKVQWMEYGIKKARGKGCLPCVAQWIQEGTHNVMEQ